MIGIDPMSEWNLRSPRSFHEPSPIERQLSATKRERQEVEIKLDGAMRLIKHLETTLAHMELHTAEMLARHTPEPPPPIVEDNPYPPARRGRPPNVRPENEEQRPGSSRTKAPVRIGPDGEVIWWNDV